MQIDPNAPAVASAEGLIHAPLPLVWSVQADLAAWPTWNGAVTRMQLDGPVEPGTVFRWTAGGLRIVSILREVEPERRIAWTGRSLGLRAAHVWTFTPEGDGVRVYTEESFDGLLARILARLLRRLLRTALAQGIADLKAECERRAARERAGRSR